MAPCAIQTSKNNYEFSYFASAAAVKQITISSTGSGARSTRERRRGGGPLGRASRSPPERAGQREGWILATSGRCACLIPKWSNKIWTCSVETLDVWCRFSEMSEVRLELLQPICDFLDLASRLGKAF